MAREGTQIEEFVDPNGRPLSVGPFRPTQRMESDMAGNGKIITGLGGLDIGFLTKTKICIGKRTSDKAGSGSYDDPFAGNTKAQVDARIRAASPYAHIHFREGNFETDGAKDTPDTQGGFRFKPWQIYSGEGIGITTLKLMSLKAAPGNFETIGGVFFDPSSGPNADGVQVLDMTVDCNGPNLGANADGEKWRAMGVLLKGSNCRIARVEIITGRGRWDGQQEAFLLSIAGGGERIYNSIIEHCIVRSPDPASDYGACATISDCGGGCEIRYNYFQDWGGTCCVGGLGRGLRILGNTAFDCRSFAYLESNNGVFDTEDLIISDNIAWVGSGHPALRFVNNGGFFTLYATGTIITGKKTKGVTLSDNTVILRPTAGLGVNANHFVVVTGELGLNSGIKVTDNKLKIDPRFTGTWPSYDAYVLGNVDDVEIARNKLERPGAINLTGSTQVTLVDEPTALADTDVLGSLRIKATKATGGSYLYGLSIAPVVYTIVAGDRLQYEVLSDPLNPAHAPVLAFYAGGLVGIDTLGDQNGLIQYQVLKDFAKGRWYFRDFDLTTVAETVTANLVLGFLSNDTGGNINPNGVYTYYFRNIVVLDSAGAVKHRYYTDESAAPHSITIESNVTEESGTPHWHPKISITGSQEYADNAEAVAAGLNIGGVYRTGDAMKVVH